MKKETLIITDKEDITYLLLCGEILGPFDSQELRAEDSFLTLKQCSGIGNLFKKARKIAAEQGYDLVYNSQNSWMKGLGAEGYFEFYRFNNSPKTVYRGRLSR